MANGGRVTSRNFKSLSCEAIAGINCRDTAELQRKMQRDSSEEKLEEKLKRFLRISSEKHHFYGRGDYGRFVSGEEAGDGRRECNTSPNKNDNHTNKKINKEKVEK